MGERQDVHAKNVFFWKRKPGWVGDGMERRMTGSWKGTCQKEEKVRISHMARDHGESGTAPTANHTMTPTHPLRDEAV